MLTYAFDRPFGIIVWLFSGQANTDDDYERYVDSIAKLSELATDVDSPAGVIIVDPGNPVPNAIWRRRIAEVSSRVRRDATVIFVGSSTLVRGTVIAVNWVKPLPFEFHVVETVLEAKAVIEKKRGYPAKLVDELLAEAREKAAARATT